MKNRPDGGSITNRSPAIGKYDIIFAVLLCLLTVVQVLRARYGLDRADESFYPTLPLRFLQGDVPVFHEWNLSQLFGILMVPIMWLYRLFGGTGEGIILNFRYIYVGFHTLSAIAIYLLLKKKSPLGALLAALLYVPFSPGGIMALSYNSMGVGCLLLAGLVLAYDDASGKCRFFAGVLFAMAVLCSPYLLFLYLIWCVCLVIRAVRKKTRSELKALTVFTAGAAAVAAVIFATIFSRAGIRDILNMLPSIMNDPEHTYLNLWDQTKNFFFHLFVSRKIALVSTAVTAVLLLALRLDKKRKEHLWLYVLGESLITILHLVVFYFRYRYISYFMQPLTLLGLVCYYADDDRDRKVFRYVYLSGWFYAYTMVLSSNNFYEALTASLTVSAAASAFFAGKIAERLLRKPKDGKRIAAAVSAVGCAVLAFAFVLACKLTYAHCTYFVRATFPTAMMDYTIDCGPAKGIRIYDNEYAAYMRRYEESAPVRNAEGKNVLYITHDCWMILADEKNNASYSSWLSFVSEDSTLKKMTEYERFHPEKNPDAVFIDKEIPTHPERFLSLVKTEDYTVEESETAYVLVKK